MLRTTLSRLQLTDVPSAFAHNIARKLPSLTPFYRASQITKRAYDMPKRKRLAGEGYLSSVTLTTVAPPPVRRSSTRRSQPVPADIDPNPDTNPNVKDGKDALRASPDAEDEEEAPRPAVGTGIKSKKNRDVTATATPKPKPKPKIKSSTSDSSLSELSDIDEPVSRPKPAIKPKPVPKATTIKLDEGLDRTDPEAADEEDVDPEELKEAISRPPPVNSSYLPLPWKGRLGYACLNTYLRAATPPVFTSRTCRIASILEHRHPLKDPSQPEHSTKNRPDKDQPADVARGQAYVEALGLANAQDIPKMLRWNDKYGIKFFRLSSEMFPFASHDVYGYKLAPFASDALAEAGRVAAQLGHRLSTHPGQFTQLGSPRPEVITASLRDLEYHCELLDLLKLPPQQNRDAVMVLHMGGIFGDKAATIDRFRGNYARLPQKIKDRLVLENDDVCYSVHDLLPVCEELNIPLVLDFHHHNIVFDADQIREGTLDIITLYDRIKATWTRKNITQKMHYSEPTPQAVTARQRRKHNPRPATLPPCPPDMDLMIEAKDKEQAVFELMRTFKLPMFDTFNDIIPYTRNDENKAWKPPKKKTPKKKNKKSVEAEEEVEDGLEPQPPPIVPDEDIAMGGPDDRVYWPPGMEEWLRPKKREVKPRDPEKAKSTAEKAAQKRAEKAAWQAAREASADVGTATTISGPASEVGELPRLDIEKTKSVYDKGKSTKAKPARAPKSAKVAKTVQPTLTPSTSDHDDAEDVDMSDLTDADEAPVPMLQVRAQPSMSRRPSGRSTKQKVVNYADRDDDDE